MYLNSHTWLSILATESLIFKQTWNVSEYERIMEYIRWFLQKYAYKKIPNIFFIHLMSFKPIKTTQKCFIFWNLLGVLISEVLYKNLY